jgi:transposase
LRAAARVCPDCGGALKLAGEDVAEVLEWVPGRYEVIRHIARSLPARVAIRSCRRRLLDDSQSGAFAREGIYVDRTPLADWVGDATHLCAPLIDAMGHYVLSGNKVHTDDTHLPLLCPDRGTTYQRRL